MKETACVDPVTRAGRSVGASIARDPAHSGMDLARAAAESFVNSQILVYSSSPEQVVRRAPDVILYSTGAKSSEQNGVLRARFTYKDVVARTTESLQCFKRKRTPMTWYVDPWTKPAKLGKYLEDMGLTPGWEIPCMATNLDVVERKPYPDGFSMRAVGSLRTLGISVDTFLEAFSDGNAASGDLSREAYMGLGLSTARRWFIGYLDGRPVSSCLLLLHEGLATIWIVATLKEARRRGIAAAMTRELLHLARQLQYGYAFVHSSRMGLPLYENLGFVQCCKIRTYSLEL